MNIKSKFGYPLDNSFSEPIDGGENIFLAGTHYSNAKLVEIISEPFKMEVEFIGEKYIHEFVIVLYSGKKYRVLNRFSN